MKTQEAGLSFNPDLIWKKVKKTPTEFDVPSI